MKTLGGRLFAVPAEIITADDVDRLARAYLSLPIDVRVEPSPR
jgi:hypothetical protein